MQQPLELYGFYVNKRSEQVREIKSKVRNLPILYVADDNAFKIVEIDASNIGWGGVLKQKPREDGPKEQEQKNDSNEEPIHVMVILTEWNQAYKREELRYIADDEPWPVYAEKWRPSWIL